MSTEERVRYLREYKRICDEISENNDKFDSDKSTIRIASWIKDDQESWWDKHWDDVVAGILIGGGLLAFILVTGGVGMPFILISGTVYSGGTIAAWGGITGLVTIVVSGGVLGAINYAYDNGDITAEERNTIVSGAQTGIGLSVTSVLIAGVHYVFSGGNVVDKGTGGADRGGRCWEKCH